MTYDQRNWFWIVGDDESKAWSSANGAYVTQWPDDRVTRIANEVELYDVLAKAGLKTMAPSRTFTVAEVRSALLRIDSAITGSATDASSLTAVADQIGITLPTV